MPWLPIKDLVPLMLDRITSHETGYWSAAAGSRIALMVNNLGGAPPMELHIVNKEAQSYLKDKLGLQVRQQYFHP